MKGGGGPYLVYSRGGEEPGGAAAGRGRLVYIVAGEPTGDRLGAGLMRALRAQAPGVRFGGVGGNEMEAAGLVPPFDLAESWHAAGGALPWLVRGANRTARDVVATAPDVLVTIGGPGGFALGVARRVRRRRPGLPTVHYGAPPVRVWRTGRVRRVARAIDQVLALLPFECATAEEAGMACDFVGHPLAERSEVGPEVAARYRAELGMRPDRPLALLAPGSRPGQVRRLLPLYRRCVETLAADRPGLGVVVAVADGVAAVVEAGLRGMRPRPHLVRPEAGGEQRWRAMAAADVALAASGTVTLELAAASTPMIVCRRENPIAALVRPGGQAGPASLVNLIADTGAVPEFHGREARVEVVAPVLAELLDDDDARARQLAFLDAAMAVLGRGGEPPSARAARAVLAAIAAVHRPGTPPASGGSRG